MLRSVRLVLYNAAWIVQIVHSVGLEIREKTVLLS